MSSENEALTTNGKYVQLKYNFDCVFIQNPDDISSGIVMSMKKSQTILNKYEKRHGDAWYFKKELKTKAFKDLIKHKYFDLSLSQWENMSKPKPFRVQV